MNNQVQKATFTLEWFEAETVRRILRKKKASEARDSETVELSCDEILKVLGVLKLEIISEANVLAHASKNPLGGAFDSFLASINRKTELLKKLKITRRQY